jgi:hypothetical protein
MGTRLDKIIIGHCRRTIAPATPTAPQFDHPHGPQYEIQSDKSNHVAMHKGTVLQKID